MFHFKHLLLTLVAGALASRAAHRTTSLSPAEFGHGPRLGTLHRLESPSIATALRPLHDTLEERLARYLPSPSATTAAAFRAVLHRLTPHTLPRRGVEGSLITSALSPTATTSVPSHSSTNRLEQTARSDLSFVSEQECAADPSLCAQFKSTTWSDQSPTATVFIPVPLSAAPTVASSNESKKIHENINYASKIQDIKEEFSEAELGHELEDVPDFIEPVLRELEKDGFANGTAKLDLSSTERNSVVVRYTVLLNSTRKEAFHAPPYQKLPAIDSLLAALVDDGLAIDSQRLDGRHWPALNSRDEKPADATPGQEGKQKKLDYTDDFLALDHEIQTYKPSTNGLMRDFAPLLDQLATDGYLFGWKVKVAPFRGNVTVSPADSAAKQQIYDPLMLKSAQNIGRGWRRRNVFMKTHYQLYLHMVRDEIASNEALARIKRPRIPPVETGG